MRYLSASVVSKRFWFWPVRKPPESSNHSPRKAVEKRGVMA